MKRMVDGEPDPSRRASIAVVPSLISGSLANLKELDLELDINEADIPRVRLPAHFESLSDRPEAGKALFREAFSF